MTNRFSYYRVWLRLGTRAASYPAGAAYAASRAMLMLALEALGETGA